MNTNSDDTNKKTISQAQFSPGTTGIGKEGEAIGAVKGGEILKESGGIEMELPKEVKEMGARVHKEVIELPPDMKKLGVTPSGTGVPVTIPTTTVVLPISDQQVVAGLHAQITSALHWLAQWCVRRLKQAHMTIKVVHGKIMRVEIGKTNVPISTNPTNKPINEQMN